MFKIKEILENHLIFYPTPKNLYYAWGFGSLLCIMFILMRSTVFLGSELSSFLVMGLVPPVTAATDNTSSAPKEPLGARLQRASWPFLLSLLPVTYILVNGQLFKVSSSVPFINELGAFALLVPPVLAGVLIFLGGGWGALLSRAIMLLSVPLVKAPLNDFQKEVDFICQTPFLVIQRLWGVEDVRNAVVFIFNRMNLPIDVSVLKEIVTHAGYSIEQARRLAWGIIMKPEVVQVKLGIIDTALLWVQANSLNIVMTVTVSALVGWALKWAVSGVSSFFITPPAPSALPATKADLERIERILSAQGPNQQVISNQAPAILPGAFRSTYGCRDGNHCAWLLARAIKIF